MKLLIISLLSALSFVLGQLDGELFAPAEPPEMVVYYVNWQAPSTVCNQTEQAYIDKKMLPDLDMTLVQNNFETPAWEVPSAATRRELQNGNANPNSNGKANKCDICREQYSRSLCNVMYNCKNRRELHGAEKEKRELQTLEELQAELLSACRGTIMDLLYSRQIGRNCKRALRWARCYVQVME
ncbi:hypothetical protein FisN_25Hh039 [Fistulifera solaris]|uniref:Saposin B-type domain-containing protein n=1 Tax=Fistulifera solaris TaxID=1519565 RepID=A0A1Z5JVK5_FISSO|nr:hypothetical protein FisN_25Hh039 [Fistulifera solaris]|eukprot:GAX18064.1 hypothetical protein FisN_25Hh039 [Fistulifera solaris]